MYSSDSAEDSERESVEKGKVGKLARRRFEAMLRLMSGKRAEIARAMEFAMKRAEAADEVNRIQLCLVPLIHGADFRHNLFEFKTRQYTRSSEDGTTAPSV